MAVKINDDAVRRKVQRVLGVAPSMGDTRSRPHASRPLRRRATPVIRLPKCLSLKDPKEHEKTHKICVHEFPPPATSDSKVPILYKRIWLPSKYFKQLQRSDYRRVDSGTRVPEVRASDELI